MPFRCFSFVFEARIYAAQSSAQHQLGYVLATGVADRADSAPVAVKLIAIALRSACGQRPHEFGGSAAIRLAALWRVKTRHSHFDLDALGITEMECVSVGVMVRPADFRTPGDKGENKNKPTRDIEADAFQDTGAEIRQDNLWVAKPSIVTLNSSDRCRHC